MSYSIFIANSTALIPQPGRSVNTFPSGLVRVDQTYLGLTAQAATHRATLAVGNNMPDGDNSPCIDGLKIFPAVQERRRGDGFTEYIVSAYGRAKSTATIERGIKSFTIGVLSIIRGIATAKIVSQEAPTLLELNFPADAFDPTAAYFFTEPNGNFEADEIIKISSNVFSSTWRFTFGSTAIPLGFLNPGITGFDFATLPLNISKTNFGYWTEWVYSYG